MTQCDFKPPPSFPVFNLVMTTPSPSTSLLQPSLKTPILPHNIDHFVDIGHNFKHECVDIIPRGLKGLHEFASA